MTAMIICAAKKIVAEVAGTVKEQFNIEVPRINYRTSARMTRVWGKAMVENSQIPAMTEYYMVLSSRVYNETNVNSNSFRKVVIHELAHLLDFVINNQMSGHGHTWSQIMKKLDETPNQYVTKAQKEEINHVAAPKRKMTRYFHNCASPTCTAKHYVGGQVHNKIMAGAIYTCRKCGTRLVHDFTLVKI